MSIDVVGVFRLMSHRNICSYFMQSTGGRLYGIAKAIQQE
jgi:hypothetical protein